MPNFGAVVVVDPRVWPSFVYKIYDSVVSFLLFSDYVSPDVDCLLDVVVAVFHVAFDSPIDSLCGLRGCSGSVVRFMGLLRASCDDQLD